MHRTEYSSEIWNEFINSLEIIAENSDKIFAKTFVITLNWKFCKVFAKASTKFLRKHQQSFRQSLQQSFCESIDKVFAETWQERT